MATPLDATESTDAALHRGARYLARRGIEDALKNARLLLAHALESEAGTLVLRLREPVAPEAARRYGKLLCSRAKHEPLQYLLGTWEFLDFEIEVGPAALIPRPETEILVERSLERIQRKAQENTHGTFDQGALLLADVGTGTGAIALALARACPAARVLAIDRSPGALALAGRNVARLGLGSRVTLVEGDLLAALDGVVERGSLAAVVSNPPYVTEGEHAILSAEVREHEPREALVAGPTGLEVYERLVPEARGWLRSGGLLTLEVGRGQAAAVEALARAHGFERIETYPDLAGIARVVVAFLGG